MCSFISLEIDINRIVKSEGFVLGFEILITIASCRKNCVLSNNAYTQYVIPVLNFRHKAKKSTQFLFKYITLSNSYIDFE